jgi:hypothetical protein
LQRAINGDLARRYESGDGARWRAHIDNALWKNPENSFNDINDFSDSARKCPFRVLAGSNDVAFGYHGIEGNVCFAGMRQGASK